MLCAVCPCGEVVIRHDAALARGDEATCECGQTVRLRASTDVLHELAWTVQNYQADVQTAEVK